MSTLHCFSLREIAGKTGIKSENKSNRWIKLKGKKTKQKHTLQRGAPQNYLFFISFAFWHHLLRSDSQGLKFCIFLLVLLLLCCCLFIFYFCLKTKKKSLELCVCVRACARVYVCVPEWCVHSCVRVCIRTCVHVFVSVCIRTLECTYALSAGWHLIVS